MCVHTQACILEMGNYSIIVKIVIILLALCRLAMIVIGNNRDNRRNILKFQRIAMNFVAYVTIHGTFSIFH